MVVERKKKARRELLAAGLIICLASSTVATANAMIADADPPEPKIKFCYWETIPTTTPDPTPTATPAPVSTAKASATWYCLPGVSRCTVGHRGGMYAAISPDLTWLGDQVSVCTDDMCIVVTVIDCNCQTTKGIDLYADAFRKLAPLGVGRIPVTLTPYISQGRLDIQR